MSDRSRNRRFANKILCYLDEAELAVLEPHLTFIDLPLRTRLELRNKPVEFVYFIEQGIASVVAGAGAFIAEVGIIGSEGMTGLPLILGVDRAAQDCFMQTDGTGHRMPARDFADIIRDHRQIHSTFLKFAHVFGVQAASTALSNARNIMEERLARWLLMADDRLNGDPLKLTHEFLAVMLGVRRPGVTLALKALVSQGLIEAERGSITLLDRGGLEMAAHGSYGTAEGEYARIFS